MKKDIKTRADIEALVHRFYDKIRQDALVGPIFNSVIRSNWEKHLSFMTDFWQNMLFYTGTYVGNPLAVHRKLHRIFPLNEEHFNRWISLFVSTVDELFEGDKAKLAKERAVSLADVMKIKVLQTH